MGGGLAGAVHAVEGRRARRGDRLDSRHRQPGGEHDRGRRGPGASILAIAIPAAGDRAAGRVPPGWPSGCSGGAAGGPLHHPDPYPRRNGPQGGQGRSRPAGCAARPRSGTLAGGTTARNYATKAANLTRVEGRPPRRGRAAPDGGGRADRGHARLDEGRRDEGRPGGLVHRHRRLPARVPGAPPGRSSPSCATRRPRVAFEEMRKVIEARPRRAARGRLRRVRGGGAGRGLDRPGLPRQAARRPAGGGQGAVPGRGRGGPRPTSRTWG